MTHADDFDREQIKNAPDEVKKELNADPITGEPGSHPVGTGLGAAGGAAAGAAVGSVGGPLGTLVGGAVGAVVGGLAGSAVGEARLIQRLKMPIGVKTTLISLTMVQPRQIIQT